MNFEDFTTDTLLEIKKVAERFFNSGLVWEFTQAHKEWYGECSNVLALRRTDQDYRLLGGQGETVEEVIQDVKNNLNKFIMYRQISSAKFLSAAEKDFNEAISFEELK